MKNLYFTFLALFLSFASFAITGPANICVSTTTTYTDPAPSGTWSSSNPAVASVGAGTGIVTSYSAGTTVLTYSNGIVTNTLTITVVTSLPPITATVTSVCVGGSIPLSNAVSGGTWVSMNTARATVSAAGNVTGVTPGSVNIQYRLGGSCTVTQSLTVNGTLSTISGATSVCVSNNAQISNGGATGTWSASNTNVGVGGSYVYGYHAGTTTITFTNATSCGAPSATHNITVIPGLSPNSGPATFCAGTTATYTNSTSGGTWSSNNSSIATIDPATGVASGVTSGWINIIYRTSAGCSYASSVTVTSGFTGFSPSSTMCGTGTTSLGTGLTGTWTSSNTSVATVDASGLIHGFSVGTSTISFFNTGCGAPTGTHVLTVVSAVSPIINAPTSSICPGSTVSLSNATPGGTWSSYNVPVASVNSATGLVTAGTTGDAVIAYAVSSGCSRSVTITVSPSTLSISGPSTVCAGASGGMTASLPGGTWSSSNSSVATISTTGTIYAVAPGSVTFTYNYSGSCASGSPTHNVTIVPGLTPIIAPSTMCAGSSVTLSNATAGGTWSSSITAAGTFNTTTLVFATTTSGSAVFRYTLGACQVTAVITVYATPAVITGASSLCTATTSPLSCSTPGGSWSSSNPSVATISPSGVVSGVAAGTTDISYSLSTGCSSVLTVTVGSSLTITANAVQACNGVYTLSAAGATSYSWAPSAGLSCATCATTTVSLTSTASYVISGTSPGCSGTGNLTVNANRIRGNISYSGASTDSFRVWLIRYDPLDSTVLAVDSTTSCMAGTVPYYQFTGPAAGSYTVKAKKLGTVPGVSGYIPTYGLASVNWFGATTVNHTTNTDLQTINMIYGTVPAGSGFIAGNVYYGAGRGTSEAPAVDMLILLRNTATNVLTYTYTDAAGAYSFNNLAYGDYVIYPEEFDYYTTPSAVITLSAATPSSPGINFKQHTDYGAITPYGTAGIDPLNSEGSIALYPNPTANDITLEWTTPSAGSADVVITDVTGREVYRTVVDMGMKAGVAKLKLTDLNNGIFMISVRSATINYNNKIEVRH